jgi:hypothetical protein
LRVGWKSGDVETENEASSPERISGKSKPTHPFEGFGREGGVQGLAAYCRLD